MSGKPTFTLRPALPGERDALEALQRRASLVHETYREMLLANPDAIELPVDHLTSDTSVVADHDGVAIGFAIVLPREDGERELDGLFVEPDCWKLGVGRAMVDRSAHMARAQGARWLYVTGNPDALGFYIRAGFEPCGFAETRFAPAPVLRRPTS